MTSTKRRIAFFLVLAGVFTLVAASPAGADEITPDPGYPRNNILLTWGIHWDL
jgi:hypothetical protein